MNNQTPDPQLDVLCHNLINYITSISLQCEMLRECGIGNLEAKQRIEKLGESCQKARQYIAQVRNNRILN